jgi:dienelactone hydrolase
MPAPRQILRVCVLSVTLVTHRLLAEAIDLNRVDPVPADQPIPIQDFVRPRLMELPILNPSGTHLAALVASEEDNHRLLVYELNTKQIETLGLAGDSDINEVHWLGDRRLLFGISLRRRGQIGLYATNVGGLTSYYPLLQYVGAQLIAVPPADRVHPLVWLLSKTMNAGQAGEAVSLDTDVRVGRTVDLLGVGMASADLEEIESNNQKHIAVRYPPLKGGVDAGFLADKNGRLAFGYLFQNNSYHLLRLEGENWVECPVNLEEIDVIGVGNSPGELVVRGPRKAGEPRPLQLMDATTGRLGQVLLADHIYDFNGALYRDPASHDMVGLVHRRNGPQSIWFTPGYRDLQKILDGFFPKVVVHLLGSDEAGKIFLVATESDRQPLIYYSVNLETRAVGLIKNSAPWLDPKRMQPTSVIKFKTRDGRQLDALITMPAGASKTNPPPLVVLAPERYEHAFWQFDAEAQFFASRGYAVLKPNHRGSPGFGWMFPPEDGRATNKMADDVIDATQALARSGLIDRARIAVLGSGGRGKFGGYLAVLATAHEPSLYRCAVAVCGVFDMGEIVRANRFYRESAPAYHPDVAWSALERLGDPAKERAKFEALSAVQQAGRIRAPLLIAYGEYAPGEEIGQAKKLESALGKNGVPCELEMFRNESFIISRLSNKVELYTRIEAFLARHLTPAPPGATAGGTD